VEALPRYYSRGSAFFLQVPRNVEAETAGFDGAFEALGGFAADFHDFVRLVYMEPPMKASVTVPDEVVCQIQMVSHTTLYS
jgi:hypothetical protein